MNVFLLSAVLAGDGAAPTAKRSEKDLELFDATSTWNFNAGTEFPGAKGDYKLDKQQDKQLGFAAVERRVSSRSRRACSPLDLQTESKLTRYTKKLPSSINAAT